MRPRYIFWKEGFSVSTLTSKNNIFHTIKMMENIIRIKLKTTILFGCIKMLRSVHLMIVSTIEKEVLRYNIACKEIMSWQKR